MYKGTIFSEFVDEIKDIVSVYANYKNRVLYGYQWNHGGGTYLEWILNNIYEVQSNYIIDDTWRYGGGVPQEFAGIS